MMALSRLAWRQYRFEIVSVIVGIGIVVAAMAAAVFRLEEVRPSAACLEYWFAGLEGDSACEAMLKPWFERAAIEAYRFIGMAPLAGGVLLGSVVVSREIEHRTTQLGWSLQASRISWLAQRVTPVAVVFILLVLALVIVVESWESARFPSIDSRASFNEYGNRGVALVARSVAAFSVAVLIGALLGRQLPALIVSGTFTLLLVWGLGFAFPYGVSPSWISQQDSISFANSVAAVRWRTGYRSLDDGEVLSYTQALGRAPADVNAVDWVNETFEAVEMVLAGARLPDVEQREGLVLVVMAIGAIGASFIVVDRRRPY